MRTPSMALCAAGLAIALVAGCKTPSVSVKGNTAKEADFSKYQTIAWAGEGGVPEKYQRAELPEDRRAIAREIILARIAEAGYTVIEDTETADLLMIGGVGFRQETVLRSNPVYDGGNFTTAVPDVEVTRGTLVLELLDRSQDALVWNGTIEGVRETGAGRYDEEKFREVLTKLMKTFPGKTDE